MLRYVDLGLLLSPEQYAAGAMASESSGSNEPAIDPELRGTSDSQEDKELQDVERTVLLLLSNLAGQITNFGFYPALGARLCASHRALLWSLAECMSIKILRSLQHI